MPARQDIVDSSVSGTWNHLSLDRRAATRFPIQRHLRCRVLKGRRTIDEGEGVTIDISSDGASFVTPDLLIETGSRVELAVSWPVGLNDGCGLQLVAAGRTVRSQGCIVAVRFDRWEFRTTAGSGERLVYPLPATAGTANHVMSVQQRATASRQGPLGESLLSR